jgi:CRISPR-associated protein Cmr3
MTFWIIEPRDPLIVRDGRPFGPNPGARAATLPFPFPSTIVGALRHKAGLDENGQFDRDQISAILKQGMRGPLLVELCDCGKIADWLLPAPADALLLDHEISKDLVQRFWLAPRGNITITNMPDDLLLIEPSERRAEKVSGDAPRFWHRDEIFRWLRTPADGDQALNALGIRELATSARMHVSVQPDQQTAREGALFQTSGLEFTWRDWNVAKHDAFVTRRFALATWFHGATPHFNGGFAPLGGERRLMRWSKDQPEQEPFTHEEKQSIYDQVVRDRRCRVLLLTPGYFTDGYRPPLTWTRGSVTATLKAAAVPRMQTISGWDLAANNGRGAPKPTRRLAPAGSVYFVEFIGLSDDDILKWLGATWMKNVSDDAQDDKKQVNSDQHRLDGFGLAVIGAWPK